MNTPITRLFLLVLLLFATLVVFTSRWTVFEAEALRNETANRRDELQEQRIKRGLIVANDGKTVLARSVSAGEGTWTRRYPQGELFGHLTGFAYTRFGKIGLERYRNPELTGQDDEVSTILRQLSGEEPVGHKLVTTVDSKAQRIALDALSGRNGAVVAIERRTGRVLVMASLPTFDPNRAARSLRGISTFNRATQSGYPPGSTFKVVTATAALDSGKYTKDSLVSGKNGKIISGAPLNNFANEDFGEISLTEALTKSVNTVWAEVGEKVGKKTMGEYMERFGFYDQPDLDYPSDQLAASGERRGGRLLDPESRFIDVGRMAIGQDKLTVTPLQMAIVAATVANGGMRMKPWLTERVIDEDGRTVERFEPEEAERVMSTRTARDLAEMMRNVVREGTGTAAALQGVEVAGKTGTAERNIAQRINQPWFIGFTDEVAVAATIETLVAGSGGKDAAPIAKQVLEALGE